MRGLLRLPRRLLRGCDAALRRLALLLLAAYQKTLGLLLGGRCRFYPSCSQYAVIAFQRFNFAYALWLTARRLLRCHPLCAGGEDHPPPAKPNRLDKLNAADNIDTPAAQPQQPQQPRQR